MTTAAEEQDPPRQTLRELALAAAAADAAENERQETAFLHETRERYHEALADKLARQFGYRLSDEPIEYRALWHSRAVHPVVRLDHGADQITLSISDSYNLVVLRPCPRGCGYDWPVVFNDAGTLGRVLAGKVPVCDACEAREEEETHGVVIHPSADCPCTLCRAEAEAFLMPRDLQQATGLMYGAQSYAERTARLAVRARTEKYEAQARRDAEKFPAVYRLIESGIGKTDAEKRVMEDAEYAKADAAFRLAARLCDVAETDASIAALRLETVRAHVRSYSVEE